MRATTSATREQAGTKRNGWLDGEHAAPDGVTERAADLEFHQVRHVSLAEREASLEILLQWGQ